jgi:DsbC/DsbD-like thiol-disulfide interchange protein
MPLLSRFITFAMLLGVLLPAPEAGAQEASGWTQGHSSRVRLIAGGGPPEALLAGIQIELDAGFKTYWRSPGEAGLPPAFDWSKSVNVEGVEVLWPAPSRFEDPGGIVYGYGGSVLLPVRVRAQDPAKPVSLAVKLDYGVCKDICIPAGAELMLTLPKSATPALLSALDGALARVPRRQPLGAEGPLSVLSAAPTSADGKPRLAVSVRAPAGSRPSLFVEPPENWFLLAPIEPTAGAADSGTRTFLVELLERPADASGPIEVRFTLVAGDKAIETTARLDAARLGR